MASLKEVLLLIRWSGFRHIIRIIQNTLKRDLQDRQYHKNRFPTHTTTPQIPGTLLGVTQITPGAQFKFQNAS